MTITVPAIIFNFYTRFFSSRECLTKGFRKSQQKANLQDNKRAREAAEPYILKRCDNRGEFLHRRGRDDSEDVITMDLIIISSSGSNETRESNGCSGRGGGFSVSAGGQKSGLRRSRRKNAGQKKQTDCISLHFRKCTSNRCADSKTNQKTPCRQSWPTMTNTPSDITVDHAPLQGNERRCYYYVD